MKKYSALFCLICFFAINHQLAAQEKCLSFDGVNDWVSLPLLDVSGQSALTIEAWIYLHEITKPSHEIYRGNGAGIPASYLLAFKGFGTNLTFGVNTFLGYKELEIPINSADFIYKWHHIAGVYDGEKMSLFVNGELMGSIDHSGEVNCSVPTTHRIGVSVSTEFFDGKIDEVRLWSTARTKEEIENDKDCAMSGPATGLVAVYNLNEESGGFASDASGNGFTGELWNGAYWTDSEVALDCTVSNSFESDLASTVNLFPNPASDRIYIESQFSFQEILISDVSGKVVYFTKLQDSNFEIADLPPGIFQVQLISEQGVIIKRFVKN